MGRYRGRKLGSRAVSRVAASAHRWWTERAVQFLAVQFVVVLSEDCRMRRLQYTRFHYCIHFSYHFHCHWVLVGLSCVLRLLVLLWSLPDL